MFSVSRNRLDSAIRKPKFSQNHYRISFFLCCFLIIADGDKHFVLDHCMSLQRFGCCNVGLALSTSTFYEVFVKDTRPGIDIQKANWNMAIDL